MPKHYDDKMPKKPEKKKPQEKKKKVSQPPKGKPIKEEGKPKGKEPARQKPKPKPKRESRPRGPDEAGPAEPMPTGRRPKKKEEDKMPKKTEKKSVARRAPKGMKKVLIDEVLMRRFALKIANDAKEQRKQLEQVIGSITRPERPEPRAGASSLDTSSGYSSGVGVPNRGGRRGAIGNNSDTGGTSAESV